MNRRPLMKRQRIRKARALAAANRRQAYIMDGELENFVRLPANRLRWAPCSAERRKF